MAKLKAKKRTKGKFPQKGFPWFLWLGIALVIVGIIAFVHIYRINQSSSVNLGEPKAAIIDQLYTLQSNQAFIQQMTQELEDYGFEVDLYQGDDVTVNLYRRLPSYRYKLVIFRAHFAVHGYEMIALQPHSGLLSGEGEIIERTCLFTNERYSQTKHVAEQLGDQLAITRIDENHPLVFGIGDEFVTQSMEGEFDNTVIIMAGCACLYLDDLARAFIDKGASTYLGWDANVDLSYVDDATISLIQNLCTERCTVEKAVAKTMAEKGPDPYWKAVLQYYPSHSGSSTIAELIG